MQFWCCPGMGPYHSFLSFTVGFFYEPLGRPHSGAIAASPVQKKKKEITTARQMLGGDGNGWNWLSYFKREVVSEEGEGLSREGGYGAFFITRSVRRIRSTVLNWPQLNKWRQKYRPRQHSRSRKFTGFNWKWLLLVRNELLIRKTLQRGESLILSRPQHLWYT